MDSNKIKEFWDKRAEKYILDKDLSATNLEEDSDLQKLKVRLETKKITSLVKFSKSDIALDLGCGVGSWSEILASKISKVIAVDYSQKMIDIALLNAREKSISNIDYICDNAAYFKSDKTFDLIFISGLLLYLANNELDELTININLYSKKGAKLVLREPVGLLGQYIINNQYSEALKIKYSALYRTNEELISVFNDIGFELIKNEDMFESGSKLNKWEETRLRIFVFVKY